MTILRSRLPELDHEPAGTRRTLARHEDATALYGLSADEQ